MDYSYAYLFGVLCIGFPLWLLLYSLRTDFRRELLMMSLFGLLISPPLVYWYTQDYWKPETITGWRISIEDLLFGAIVTGISAVLYQIIFQRKYGKKLLPSRGWIIPIFLLLNLFAYVVNVNAAININSIYLTSVISVFLAGLMILIRRDLVLVSIITGLMCTGVWMICYLLFLPLFPAVFQRWWMLHNLSGSFILGIPIEEFLWSLSWGMFIGPLYKFATGKMVK